MRSHPIVTKPVRTSRTLSPSDPFRDLENQFWQLFGRPANSAAQMSEMKLDISEDDKAYQIKAEQPGVKKEDIAAGSKSTDVQVK